MMYSINNEEKPVVGTSGAGGEGKTLKKAGVRWVGMDRAMSKERAREP